jgi:hypothetical protein
MRGKGEMIGTEYAMLNGQIMSNLASSGCARTALARARARA